MSERNKRLNQLYVKQAAVISELKALSDRWRCGQAVGREIRAKRSELENLKEVYSVLRGY